MKEDNPGDFSSYVIETPFMQKERIKETEQIIEDLKADMQKLLEALESIAALHLSDSDLHNLHIVVQNDTRIARQALEQHKAKYGEGK